MADNVYDAIVIGSGISGGWAAKELCEKGLKTIMLERGKDIKHDRLSEANKEAWDHPHRGGRTGNDQELSCVEKGLSIK
jgi:choline dehydrogenase-like flavoprotein